MLAAVPLVLLPLRQAAAQGAGGGLGFNGLQPPLGTDVRVGDLRPTLENFLTPAPPLTQRPAWIVTPAIETSVGVTDNSNRVSSPRRADIITVISPQLSLDGDTNRLKVNFSYTPQITVYAINSRNTSVNQLLNGQAHAIVVPDQVFVDLRASITESSGTTGGFNQNQTQSYGQQNDVQTTSVSLSPYAQHRFGGWADGMLRYTLNRTQQSYTNGNPATTTGTSTSTAGASAATLAAYGQSGYGNVGNLTTQQELASLGTGENFGRYNDTVTVQLTQYDGSGSYKGAYRNEAQNEVGVAIDHRLTLLAGIGYESLAFAGNPGYRLNSGTYNVGFRYKPDPDTLLTVQYGRHEGDTALTFNGQVAPTARTRVTASYTNGVTTDLEQAQTQLATTTVGPNGSFIDPTTGAPVTTNRYNALQNGIYRLARFSANLVYLQERDSVSFSISNEQRTSLTSTPTLVGNGVVPAGTNTTSTYGSIAWQHDLRPNISLITSAQYGISTNTGQVIGTGNSNQRTLSLSAALTRQFTETLSGSLRYTFTDQSGNQLATSGTTTNGLANTGTYTENIFLIGLRKSF